MRIEFALHHSGTERKHSHVSAADGCQIAQFLQAFTAALGDGSMQASHHARKSSPNDVISQQNHGERNRHCKGRGPASQSPSTERSATVLDRQQCVVFALEDREVLGDPHDLEDLDDERLDVGQLQLAAA